MSIFKCFDTNFCNAVLHIPKEIQSNISEVRVRCDKPTVIYCGNMPFLITTAGELLSFSCAELEKCSDSLLTMDNWQLKNAFYKLCEYSVYKRQGEINNGFITLSGGHRIGICGTAVLADGAVKSITDIVSLNIRIARQYFGCADSLFDCNAVDSGCLIIGVPSSGKTTILRDVARRLTLKHNCKVSVIDERFELSAAYNGVANFDLGLSDIYSGYPKRLAIVQAIRSMSPHYIICDELTGDDIDSAVSCVNFGVKMIASVHGDNLENVIKNRGIMSLIKTGAFESLVFLDSQSPCKITKVIKTEELCLD